MEIILVPRFPTNRWSLPQTTDPTAPGYVTARVPKGVSAAVEIVRWPLMQKPHGATLHIIQVGVGGRQLGAGEPIEVVYGDQSGGSLGAQVQASAREVAFPVFVASGQEPRFLERFVSWNRETDVATLRDQADYNPTLRVVGGRAASFYVVAPMEVAPGQPFAVRLSVLDPTCNAATGYAGEVEVRADEPGGQVMRTEVSGAGTTVEGMCLDTAGFHRLYAIDPNRGVLGVSNPIRVVAEPQPIQWGEIHGHSEQSDGNGTPDEHYGYARDVALLDFACVCDHDKALYAHPERWSQAMDKVRAWSEAGRFVAVLGYEGRLAHRESGRFHGDINVYYRQERGEMLAPFEAPLRPEDLGNEEVLLIPHTPLYGPETSMGTHWEDLTGLPAESMPLVEVFSTHGNSEYYDCPRHLIWQARGQSVQDALARGFRLGMIGSSDYHEVLTGNLLRIQDTPRTVNNRHMQGRCGLAAVRGCGLERGELFEALRARQTYATSGIRAYVDFRVNGQPMGSELTVDGATPRRLQMAVAAPERIVKLEVLRSNEVIADLADGGWRVETEMEDAETLAESAWYYVRATTERTDFAWSSPVWVEVDGGR